MAYCNSKKNLPQIDDVIVDIVFDNDEEYNTGCDVIFKSGKRIICHVKDERYREEAEKQTKEIFSGQNGNGEKKKLNPGESIYGEKDCDEMRGKFYSKYDIGDWVHFLLSDKDDVYTDGKVVAVTFKKGKVLYDVFIPNRQVIKELDSEFIIGYANPDDCEE